MHSENFKADFLKMASATHATFNSKKRHIHIFFGVKTWFKYQNNEKNLQIWDMQVTQIANV